MVARRPADPPADRQLQEFVEESGATGRNAPPQSGASLRTSVEPRGGIGRSDVKQPCRASVPT